VPKETKQEARLPCPNYSSAAMLRESFQNTSGGSLANCGERIAADLIGPLFSLAFLSLRRGRGPPCTVKNSTSGRGGSGNIKKKKGEGYDQNK
jgi:hypothetical protein